ncbi:MAG: hypothetical protein U1F61_31070 [Opitutaceae bacterium]
MHTSIIKLNLITAVLLVGCHSRRNETQDNPPPKTVAPFLSAGTPLLRGTRWPVPEDLPSFGTASASSILVAVFGMRGAVRRPGYYYLPKGSVVRDAVEAAQGLGRLTWWQSYSGLERPKLDGSFEVISFTKNRSVEEQIELFDGDRLYFGHEVY